MVCVYLGVACDSKEKKNPVSSVNELYSTNCSFTGVLLSKHTPLLWQR